MTTTPRPAPLLTVTEAAEALSVSRSMVYNLMDRGELAFLKLGRSRRIIPAELEALMTRSSVGPVLTTAR